YYRREAPPVRQERKARELFGGGEDVRLSGDQGVAERLVEEILLHHFPREQFARAGTALVLARFGHRSRLRDIDLRAAFLRVLALREQAVGQRVLDLAGIAQDVGRVEPDDAIEVVDAVRVVV